MATHKEPATYLSPREVAERLGVRVHAVLIWIASGELRAANLATKRGARRPLWKIAPADLEVFLVGRGNSPATPPARRPRNRSDDGVIQYFPTR